MIHETLELLSRWNALDTWIVVTGALAAMACALPGTFLVLRRQSMMGDALSHTVLLGIVGALLAAHALRNAGWNVAEFGATGGTIFFLGAIASGLATALLSEWVQRFGHVENSAALGVVFTTLFAAALLTIRLAADDVHVDADCVLFGNLELVFLDTIEGTGIPQAAAANGLMLAVNMLLLVLFFKELRITAFDPRLATTMGINARLVGYGLMTVTAITLVAAFRSVGSILVIALLIAPAATASLLARRLPGVILTALAVAALSALLGHVAAITVPALVFSRLGYPDIRDAGSAGSMAVAAGGLFLLALLFSPGEGVISRSSRRWQMSLRVTREDLLGIVYRAEELDLGDAARTAQQLMREAVGVGAMTSRLALWSLIHEGRLVAGEGGYRLTDSGRRAAQSLVRSHRLWESYMIKHLPLPDDHLHETAERVEHYLDPEFRERLADELQQPQYDPHGKPIPPEARHGGS